MVSRERNFIIAVQVLFIGLFSLFLAAPFLQEQFELIPYEPVVENRRKAERPEGVLGLFDSQSKYAHRYETFFNDNYGLRDLLIRVKNQIDYTVFGTSDEVLIGKDGWLFYRHLYQRDMLSLEQERHRLPMLFHRLQSLNQNLKERGIQLVLVPCPAKTTINRKRVPTKYPAFPERTVFQQYREFLRAHPEIASIDVQGLMEGLQMQTFHKTDFHWTDPAGAAIWKHLHLLLAEKSGLPTPKQPRIRTVRKGEFGGGEIDSLAVLFPPKEPLFSLREPLASSAGDFVRTRDPNQWSFTAAEADDPTLLPPTVLIGDSFADAFLRAGFTSYFKRLHKFSTHNFIDIIPALPTGTRFVVIEHIESHLLSMLQDSWWPEEFREGGAKRE